MIVVAIVVDMWWDSPPVQESLEAGEKLKECDFDEDFEEFENAYYDHRDKTKKAIDQAGHMVDLLESTKPWDPTNIPNTNR